MPHSMESDELTLPTPPHLKANEVTGDFPSSQEVGEDCVDGNLLHNLDVEDFALGEDAGTLIKAKSKGARVSLPPGIRRRSLLLAPPDATAVAAASFPNMHHHHRADSHRPDDSLPMGEMLMRCHSDGEIASLSSKTSSKEKLSSDEESDFFQRCHSDGEVVHSSKDEMSRNCQDVVLPFVKKPMKKFASFGSSCSGESSGSVGSGGWRAQVMQDDEVMLALMKQGGANLPKRTPMSPSSRMLANAAQPVSLMLGSPVATSPTDVRRLSCASELVPESIQEDDAEDEDDKKFVEQGDCNLSPSSSPCLKPKMHGGKAEVRRNSDEMRAIHPKLMDGLDQSVRRASTSSSSPGATRKASIVEFPIAEEHEVADDVSA
jgi:hypothetical protein